MYFNQIQSKFNNYALSIKEELLDQIINRKSNSRIYFDIKYNELLYKYLYDINNINYNTNCSEFIHEVYRLVPVLDTM